MDEQQQTEIDLLDYLNVLVRRRRMIVRNVLAGIILLAVISFILPSAYTARTTILPPEDKKSAGLLTALANSPLSGYLLSETGTTADLFVEILKSRSVLDGVLQQKFEYPPKQKDSQKLSLLEILNEKSLEKGRKKLIKKMSVQATAESIVRVDVEMKYPQLAADVANALVQQLDRINKEKSSSKAKNSRIYIENQLMQTEEKLKSASEELVDFKEKHKAVALEQQTEAAIKEAGEIKGRIIAKEVELGVAMQSLKLDHISIIKLKKELEELRKQYDYLQYGGEESFKTAKEFFIPFAEVPGVGLDLARFMREVKVQETVWELLNQQYYHAKIQEARDTPTVQVLDEAVPPETRSKPKRKLIVLVGGFLLLLGSVFWAYALDFYQTLQQDLKSRAKSQLMFKDFKADIDQLKSLTKRKKRSQKKRSN